MKQVSSKQQRAGIAIALAILALLVAVSAMAADAKQHSVLAFGADWCRQCQIDKRHYPQLRAKYNRVVYVDADKHPGMIKKWRVGRLPTYVVLSPRGEVMRTKDVKDLL